MRIPKLLALLTVLCLAPPLRAEEPAVGVEDLGTFVPYGLQVDDEGHLTWIVTRVLDAWTRLPVAGATVDVLREATYPAPDKHTPMAETRTDKEGWARLHFDPALKRGEWPHWIRAHHPDYASTAEFGVSPDELLLRRRGESHIRVLDPLDRPVADALLDHLLGCGHCPTILSTRTDADGVGILRGVQDETLAQTWLLADGLYAHYAEFADWLPGDKPIDHHARWSITYEGRVVDAEGKPLEGIAVGLAEFHRGPWAHTDKDGRFRAIGSDLRPGQTLYFGLQDCTRKGWARDLQGDVRLPLEGVPILLRLPSHPDEVEGTHWEFPEPVLPDLVRVEIHAPGGQDPESVPFLASRLSDGLTVRGWQEEEPLTLHLAPGKWLIEAGWPRPRGVDEVGAVRVEINVPRAPDAPPVQLTLPAPRLLRTALGPVVATGSVEVVTEGSTYNVTDEARSGEPFGVPPTGAVYLRIEDEGPVHSRPRVIEVPERYLAPGAAAMPVRMPAPVTVRLRAQDPDGRAIPTRATALVRRGDWSGRDDDEGAGPRTATHELRLYPDTTPLIAVEPAFGAPLRTHFLTVPRDTAPGATIDLGVVTFERVVPSSVRVVIPDDVLREDPGGLRAALRRYVIAVRVTDGEKRFSGELTLDDQNEWQFEWKHGEPHTIPPGAEVRLIPGASSLPDVVARFPATGPGLVVRWPAAELRIELVGVDDEKLGDDTLVVDGHLIDGGPPPVRVLGLGTGTHTVVASAPGYASQRLTIRLEAGQVVTRKITLRRLR